MKSVMNYNFAQIPPPEIQRSVFDRSHGVKTTFDSDYLVPVFVDEILPGDTLSLKGTFLARLGTLIAPIMDNVFLDVFFFFVPCRLVWENWEKFQGAKDDPADTTEYTIPKCYQTASPPSSMNAIEGSLFDYMGIPPNLDILAADCPNAMPFRAYNLIWNEWFRHPDLQAKIAVDLDDGPDDPNDYSQLKKRNKRHDYFTSCLPWPQKGDAIPLPLGTSAPVIGNGTTVGLTDGTNDLGLVYEASGGFNMSAMMRTSAYGDPAGTAAAAGSAAGAKTVGLTTSAVNSGMIADLTATTAATINQLREAFAFQKILERDARGGTRYVEILKAHFGVTSPDFRLQRPEYLGGSSQRVEVRQVAQTSETQTPGTSSPQANLAAYGQSGSYCGFNKSFVEHGYVIGLVNLRADINYQQGMARMWSRETRFDFYMPALAHLGEQEVLRKEIFMPDNDTSSANTVFGYQERWAEYRYKPSMITGKFRSDASQSLDQWHLAQDFAAAPVLNSSFMESNTDFDRVVTLTAEPHCLLDCYFSMRHARPMPTYSVPGQIDRF